MDFRKPILVTGAAGFIGFHIALKMLEAGWIVTGLDNINDYYDVRLKRDRLSLLLQYPGFKFFKLDLENHSSIEDSQRVFIRHSGAHGCSGWSSLFADQSARLYSKQHRRLFKRDRVLQTQWS